VHALATILFASAESLPIDSIAVWWERHQALAAGERLPFDQALRGGFAADRLGYAFASGYQAALRALVPDLPITRVASLCVTERGGGRPRAIEATLRPSSEGGYRLDGEKRWATLADDGGLFLVAATTGADEQGRSRIRVALVDSSAPGVTVSRMPETPFIPEIPHAELRFEAVLVSEEAILPGDGYARYIRPFRTVEDIHVNGALFAYLIGEARRHGFAQSWIERLSAGIAALRGLAQSDPDSPAVHIALAGVFRTYAAWMSEFEALWAKGESPAHARWERDRLLLGVAESARISRLEKAWERLSVLRQASG
jgi:acyl-CoA dehydrogenase